MPSESCKLCGEWVTEQPTVYETVNLPGVPKHSARFYEQWFVCRNGDRKGYISGHGRAPGDAKVIKPNECGQRSLLDTSQRDLPIEKCPKLRSRGIFCFSSFCRYWPGLYPYS